MTGRTLLAAVAVLAGAVPVGLVSGAGAYPEANFWSPVGADVPLDAKILIGWTMAMDLTSVEDAFSLTDGVRTYPGPFAFAWTHRTSPPYGSEARPLFALNSSTTYRGTVLPIATDASGQYPLDQDGNGVGGEMTDALVWDFTTEDAIPPRVVTTAPGNGTANVPVTTDVVVEFSEAMDTGSTSEAFSIVPSADGVVLWDPVGTQMTFSPTLNFQYGTVYTASLAGTAKDLAGNPLDGDGDGTGGDPYVFQFATEPDVAPPTVDTVAPYNGELNVSVSSRVVVRFSETMHRDSVADAISVMHGTTVWTKANGTLTWSGAWFADDTVAFNPFENLPFATGVGVVLNASIARDPAGFYLDGDRDGASEGSPADDVLWSFTTEATDLTPPTASAARPISGSSDVPETTDIVLGFSESMNTTSVEDAFSLASALRTWTKADGTFAWSQGLDEVTYIPSATLTFATRYTIRLAGDARDVNGNFLDGNADGTGGDAFASAFTTRAEPDAVPPSVTSTTPVDAATRVTRRPTISITFDDAMKREETASAISMEHLVGPLSTPVDLGAFEWWGADHTVSFAPASDLEWDSLYRVSVGVGARDDAGLQLSAPYAFTFRTEPWSGRVTGIVVEGEAPLAGVSVTLGNGTTQTNETGVFAFDGVEAGTYEVVLAKEGYVPVRLTKELNQWAATGDGGRLVDLGTISLRRADIVNPVVVASVVGGALAAALTVGLLLRRRRRRLVSFEDLEPDEGEAER